jgi:hypothetical protein
MEIGAGYRFRSGVGLDLAYVRAYRGGKDENGLGFLLSWSTDFELP